MSDQSELAVVRAPEVGGLIRHEEPTLGQMMQAIIKEGVTRDNAEVLKTFAELQYKAEARDAERRFNAAFVALQARLPVIVASSIIPNRGKYERFEDVMKVVGPLLQEHGFSVAFSQDFKENRILETCTLRHIAGHSVSNSFAVRASGKADSETQADCKASTTAKRNSLLNALNIIIRQDCLTEENDASIEGTPISAEKAFELERRVKELNVDTAAFLKYAGANKFSEILSGAYPILDDFLRKKEKGRKA